MQEKQPLKGNVHFLRRCFLQTGKYEGFYSFRSVVGHGVAIFGLLVAGKMFYNGVAEPLYTGYFKPGAEQIYTCT